MWIGGRGSGLDLLNMTPEEIRKQIMGSAYLEEEEAESLYVKAEACFSNKNYSEALMLAEKAADQGHAAACNLVGWCYGDGLGTKKNYDIAQKHFELAAKAGFPRGMRNYAITLINNDYGRPNYELAIKYLCQADDAGEAKAPAIMGCLYLDGKGIEKNPSKGVQLLKKSIDRGSDYARYHFAICLKNGDGIAKDLDEALKNARALQEKKYEGADDLVAELESEIANKTNSSSE